MSAGRMFIVLVWSALLPAVTLAQDHSAPSAETVKQLRRHHHGGDWWRITTDSARYEVRVSAIDEEGLAGVRARPKAPPAPDRIAWGSIVRIDLRKSHQTRGQIRGLILGLCAGFIPLSNGNANSLQPRNYMLVGGAAGFYLGRKLGAADVHEKPLYVAPIPPPSTVVPVVAVNEAARPETSSVLSPSVSIGAVPTTVVPPRNLSRTESLAIDKACSRLSTLNLLRIRGDFGVFCGYAATVGPEGLGGLRVETTHASVVSPGSLAWERVDHIEVQGNNARRGAIAGALALGGFGGLLGFPIGALAADGSDASQAGVVLGCAAVGAGIGMALGAAGGAMSSGWHVVYRRP